MFSDGLICLLDAENLQPRPALLVADTFTRADSAVAPGNPESGPTGAAWTPLAGTWGIASGAAYSPTIGASESLAVVDAGAQDGVFEANIVVGVGAIAGLCVRLSDAQNYLACKIQNGLVRADTRIANATTLQGQAGFAVAADQLYRFTVRVKGALVQVLVDGVQQFAFTLSDAEMAALTGTKSGLIAVNSSATRFDSYTVRTPGLVDGCGIESAVDASGRGAVIRQNDPNYQPTYRVVDGVPCIGFEQPGAGLSITFAEPLDRGAFTAVAVARITANPNADQCLLALPNQTGVQVAAREGALCVTNVGSSPEYSGLPFPTSADGVIVVSGSASSTRPDGPGCYLGVDGQRAFRTQDANGVGWTGGPIGTAFLGGLATGQGAQAFQGRARSLAVYNRVLTIDQAASVRAELALRSGARQRVPVQNVFFGIDSQSVGATGTATATTFFQSVVAAQSGAGQYLRAWNLGVSGRTLTTALGTVPAQIAALVDVSLERNVAVVFGGTNDLARTPGSPTAAFNDLKALCQAVRAAGCQVVVVTCPPRGATAQFETDRQAFNTAIRGDASFYDALADVGADATLGAAGAQNNTTYFQGDRIHFTGAGHAIIANLINAALATIPFASVPVPLTAVQVGEAVRMELAEELARVDTTVSSRATPGAAMSLTSPERQAVREDLARADDVGLPDEVRVKILSLGLRAVEKSETVPRADRPREVLRGFDYHATDERALTWALEGASSETVPTGAAVECEIIGAPFGPVPATVTLVGTLLLVQVDLNQEQTAQLSPDRYDVRICVLKQGRRVPLLTGRIVAV